MRACRGKAAALCNCRGKAGRQMVPGDEGIPSLPDGNHLAAWQQVELILKKQCAFGSDLMSYSSLLDAAHCPPPDHDFTRSAWRCRHCERDVFSSWEEFNLEKEALKELKERADGGDERAAKMYSKVMTQHAQTHLDQQMKFTHPVSKQGPTYSLLTHSTASSSMWLKPHGNIATGTR
eukprot:4259937-Pleurochrysis_carterae.AAC.2